MADIACQDNYDNLDCLKVVDFFIKTPKIVRFFLGKGKGLGGDLSCPVLALL